MRKSKKDDKNLSLTIICLLLALMSVITLNVIIMDESIRISNSIFSIVVMLWSYYTIKGALTSDKDEQYLFEIIMGLSFSLSLIIGDNLQSSDYTMITSWRTWAKFIGLSPLVVALFRILKVKVKKWCIVLEEEKKIERTYFGICWILIFLCWLPVFLAAWPGIYAYDAITQTSEFFSGKMSGHHPIAHTVLLGGCISVGEKLFGTYESGMAIYTIIQMLVLSSVFAYVISKLRSWGIPNLLIGVCLIYYMLLPIHSVLSISATKDIIFTALFTLVVVYLVEFGKKPEQFVKSPLRILRFILVVFLMTIFRNNGIYAFVVAIPFVIHCGKRYWKKLVVICMICVALYAMYSGPISKTLHVTPGNFREALSVPIQQLSRAMLYNENELSEEQKNEIQKLIPDYKSYSSRISDSTKGTFKTEEMEKDKIGFLKLWLSVGLKCPVTYVDAFLSNNIGFWYTDMTYPDPSAFHAYIEWENTPYDFHTGGEYSIADSYLLIARESKLPFLNEVFHKWAYGVLHQKVPVVSMFFNISIYAWILLGTVVICSLHRKWMYMPACMILFGLWITCLLSPVVWIRYGYPLMTCMPLLLYMALACFKD